MQLNTQDAKDLHALLLAVFTNTADLRTIVSLTGRNFEDYTSNANRRSMYSELVVNAAAEDWLDDLLGAVYDNWLEESDTANRDVLAGLYRRIWPPAGIGEPHTHLLTGNVAFVNRNTMRQTVANVIAQGSPNVLIVKGDTLAGTSYCWHLIRHVAHEDGAVHTVQFNFDSLAGDKTPENVMRVIARKAGFGPVPTRIDLIGSDGVSDTQSAQLVQALAEWFLQQAGTLIADRDKALWLVVDNAHRDTIPPPTKELLMMLVDEVGTGQIDRLAMFMLGCDTTPAHSFMIEEIDVPRLGRADVRDFLTSAAQALGNGATALGNFASVNEALDELTQGCNFASADMQQLHLLSKQLTSLMRSL